MSLMDYVSETDERDDRTHSPPYACPAAVCGETFETQSEWNRHIEAVHITPDGVDADERDGDPRAPAGAGGD